MSHWNTRRLGRRKGSGGYRLDANPDDCVLWDGNINAPGYGRLWVEVNDGARALRYAHRVAWEVWFHPIPTGMTVDHLCSTSACVYPPHMELVTLAENRRRADARVTHCPRAHEYSDDNTWLSKEGLRTCRECHRQRERARHAKLRLTLKPHEGIKHV